MARGITVMADRKAIIDSMSRRGLLDSRETAAKRQRVIIFAIVGLILAAAAYIQFGGTTVTPSQTQAESSQGLLNH